MSERITIFGAGYVGLVSGVCLAHSGHDVSVLDVDRARVDALRSGSCPIYEPGLEELLAEGLAAGRLGFEHVADAGRLSGIVMIAVGTPQTLAGAADMRYVRGAIEQVRDTAEPGTLVVMKSTVPAGTGAKYAASLKTAGIGYASNPEFLREGSAVKDWFETDRVVIGGDEDALRRLRELYSDIDAPVIACDVTSAEMIKYASNAFLATKISFINEIASICDRVGADVQWVAHGVGMDKRIGPDFLSAGIGYGGSCFPKDTRALDFLATMNGYDFHLLRSVIEVNSRQRLLPVRALRERLGGLDGARVAVLGLTFKPQTDDVREAPAADIIRMLLAEGADVIGYNPIRVDAVEGVPVAASLHDAMSGAAAAIVTTEWPEIAGADWTSLVALMSGERIVYDGRNCLDPDALAKAGATYIGVGRRAKGGCEDDE